MKVLVWRVEAFDRHGNVAARIDCLTEETRDSTVAYLLTSFPKVTYEEVEETI